MGRPATKKPSPVDAGDAAATKNVTKAPAAKTAAKKSGSKRHRKQGKKDKMMTVVAQQWKALEDKSKYHTMADEEKKQFESR
uniref:HMG box domain-containing protein n=1 Tax=Ditylenchus dipsaci TaxID=166011 RepID=A0A915CK60_9BILA